MWLKNIYWGQNLMGRLGSISTFSKKKKTGRSYSRWTASISLDQFVTHYNGYRMIVERKSSHNTHSCQEKKATYNICTMSVNSQQ